MRALLHPTSEAPAVVDDAAGRTLTHAELAARAEAVAERLAGGRTLVFCRAALTAETITGYLGALAAGHAVALVDDALDPALLAALEERYRPRFVLGPDGAVAERDLADDPVLHPDLTLLMSTSGTTGSPKLVRLSAANVEANARAIAAYLALDPGERALAALPLHYCYGLSVLHSHLLAGAAVVLPAGGLLSPAFWAAAERHGATSLAGVPHSFALLRTMGFERRAPATLRTVTQAGGRMAPDAVRDLAATMAARGGHVVVMYGQTEATARMAYLPPERIADKAGSVGIPVPGGRLDVEGDGEIVFRGPNVMLGYATGRADLALGDVQGGVLRTGDLGHQDDEGFTYVTGRRGRFAKLAGLRVSLDDVERALPRGGAAVERDERAIRVFVCDEPDPGAVRALLARRFRLSPRSFDVRVLDALPRTGAGKVDYARLRST